MTNPDIKKKKRQVWAAGIMFGVVLIVVCLLLFLLSDAGASLLARLGATTTVYEPVSSELPSSSTLLTETALPEETPKSQDKVSISKERFLERAQDLGAEFTAVLSSENDRMAAYTVESLAGETASLVLSLQKGSVTAFTISMQQPFPPAPLAADAGWIMQQEHAAQQERYEAGIAWYCDVFSACALALDYEETLPYVDVLSLKETVDAALRESKSGTGRAGAFQLDTSIDAEEMCVTTFRSIS